ncbi:sensor histidine kinase [Cytobacillus sp. IB215665]|uniref:sensor histidine kinase n=1 Tax=Cytobacillus sp. IB215665 TaxID=3097357 RepID=UPI002A164B1B|nr:sensor histidine kinase [Cytobacillus sp. IB215665]MDX8367296.1 sensor histidine kinase [Cytobacillus sp. IB215665]
MKTFLIRLTTFSALWGGFLYVEVSHSTRWYISILVCALSFVCFFFIPIVKKKIIFYFLLLCMLFVSSVLFIQDENTFSKLLFLYITIDAISLLSQKQYQLFSVVSVGLMGMLLIFTNAINIELVVILIFCYYLSILLNKKMTETNYKQDMYEELLGEYRNLKRISLRNERAARLEERTGIAREIHDSVGHKLTALLMQIEILSMKEKRQEYGILKELVRESLEETRHAVKTLKDEEFEGLSSVLQLIRKLESESHILVHFTTKQGALSVSLSNQQSVTLYRVIQEALTNAMRHAQSREVFVTIGKSAVGDLYFEVTNKIFKTESFTIGFGLSNMRKRVEELNGDINFNQTESHFVVKGSFPVYAKEVI